MEHQKIQYNNTQPSFDPVFNHHLFHACQLFSTDIKNKSTKSGWKLLYLTDHMIQDCLHFKVLITPTIVTLLNH